MTRYLTRALLATLAIFLAWWALIASVDGLWILEDASLGLVVVALLVVSRIDVRRKTQVLGVTGLLFVLVELVMELTGILSVVTTGIPAGQGELGRMMAAGYHAFRIGAPIAALLYATGGDVASLWQDMGGSKISDRCPVCGKRKTGLVAHIRDVHGEKALAKARARGEV